MKTLYTKKDFQSAKSRQKLPLKCCSCDDVFYKPKNEIQKYLKGHSTIANKYCSNLCKNKNKFSGKNVKCLKCNNIFYKNLNNIKRSPNNFCSKSCAAKYNNKISTKKSLKGKCKSCEKIISASKTFCSSGCKKYFRSLLPKKSYKEKKEIHRVFMNSYRKKIKKMAIEYKGGKCEICGYNKCTRSLNFHHKIPSEKDFTISYVTYRWEKIKNEIDKCILVCSNCHGEIHDGLVTIS